MHRWRLPTRHRGSSSTAPRLPRHWMAPMRTPVRSQQARAEAAHTNVVLERRNRFPDITVGVGAMQLGNGIESTELMLEVEIPFQQRARRERERESRLLEEIGRASGGESVGQYG